MIEIGKSLIRPEGSEVALPIQSPTAFYETRRVPGIPTSLTKAMLERLISGEPGPSFGRIDLS